ncbi:MAG: UvrD-helicase domain-containing protein, partial [Clostridia bacterium]|nr:UvrD-helicase domain-containing protein [Clostridia bacterium]
MGNEIQRFTAAKRELFDRIYGRLNPEQREAIYTVNGPLLVLAGAGSGKTTVLVNRISHMIKYGDAYFRNGSVKPSDLDIEMLTEAYKFASNEDAEMILSAYAVDPVKAYGILAITFTNKAADEIKNRLAESLNDESISSQIWAGTFHSICVRILRRHLDLLGFQSGSLTIYDTEDTKKLIGDILKSLNIDDRMLPVRTVMTEISRAKDNLISPEDFSANSGNDYRLSQISKVYIRYQSELQKANAMDFDDLIMRTVMLLKDNKDVLDYYQSKFRYICVDEYQDTNMAQFALIELLSGKYRNIMVVGDDDQSIYKFRGATIKNILEFDTVFSDCKLIKLEQNYRSTQTILNAANSIIKNNFGRKGKNLWTEKQAGEKIVLEELEDQNEESRYIVDTISEYVKSGTKTYKDFAVLYRLNAQANNIESAFARSGMPYRVFGSIRFYDRKEIRDILAYLYLIKNPGDNLHLKRIINTPKRKIGNSTINAVEQLSACENKSMMEIMKKADTYVSIIKSAEKLISFVK